MLQKLELSLRCWHSSGRPIHPNDLMRRLGVDDKEASIFGEGKPWEAARVLLANVSVEDFNTDPEPSESLAVSLQASLVAAGRWLASIDRVLVDAIRQDGFSVDAFADALVDQNQLDINFPPVLMAELGRLELFLCIVSND